MGARGLMRDGSIQFRPTLVDDGIERSESASPPLASRDEKRIQFIRASDLDQLGDARWAIDKALPFEGIVEWIAAKGSLKTYTALDTQIRATVGIDWFGRRTKPSCSAYVYAEGPFGAKARIDAACAQLALETGLPINRHELELYVLPTRVPINNLRAVGELVGALNELPSRPEYITVDTLSANIDGPEDDGGMRAFAAGCTVLREKFKACVVVVHHTPLSADDRGRGHQAFDGAADVRFVLSRDDNRVTVHCSHSRHAEDGWEVHYETVVGPAGFTVKPSSPTGGGLSGQRRQLLELVSEQGHLSYTKLLEQSQMKPASFKKARKWLAENAYIKQSGAKYTVTDAGLLVLGSPRLPEGYRG